MLTTVHTIQRGVLDAIQDMLRVLDASQQVVLTNQSYENRFGVQTGNRCVTMFSKTGKCKNCVSRKAVETGVVQRKKCTIRGRVYEVSAAPFLDENQIISGTVEVFRDITEARIRQKNLTEQNTRLLHEAKIAARMQRDLFMSQGQPDERVTMASRYLPASSMGGDMFGCLHQKDGRIAFYVADVSGHGIAAAMISLLLANAMRGIYAMSAGHILNRAREAFVSMVQDDQLYVSMFVAILDPKTGKLNWANAGLNAVPLLYGKHGLERLYSPALPICNWKDIIIYPEHVSELPENGRLLLYTDGLLDQKSSTLTEEELEERMVRLSGDALLKNLEKQVLLNHVDDVCMLLIGRPTARENP